MGAQWKHKGKQENSAAKGKVFSRLAKAIIMAAKGGADPATNAKLRIAVDAAKKASLPRDTLERAIKKGAGLLDEQVSYDTVVFEGFGPHRVPVIVECLTDNKNRTTPNMRFHFKKGQLGTTGSVSWDFDHLGMIEATGPDGADSESVAIEAGAQDLEAGDDGATRFFTDPADLDAVTKALAALGWTVTSATLGWKAKNPVPLDDTARAEVEAWLAEVDADDDVQTLYVALA
ncbi:MAG: YebC/PmpR family DNA-binding transcriptional regulator [Kofleriaceae bacterium]